MYRLSEINEVNSLGCRLTECDVATRVSSTANSSSLSQLNAISSEQGAVLSPQPVTKHQFSTITHRWCHHLSHLSPCLCFNIKRRRRCTEFVVLWCRQWTCDWRKDEKESLISSPDHVNRRSGGRYEDPKFPSSAQSQNVVRGHLLSLLIDNSR